jgi:hypothetical protein
MVPGKAFLGVEHIEAANIMVLLQLFAVVSEVSKTTSFS